jgi:hypothetical protein
MKGTLGQSTPPGVGSSSGNVLYAGFWKDVLLGMVTEVEETPAYRNELLQNYPNPFNPVTTIEYSVSHGGYAELTIFNVLGQRVRTLVNEHKVPGRHRAIWDGRNDGGRMVATGMYFYRLRIDSFVSVKKMVLIR